MPRKIIEFLCTECHKYFNINLNVSLNGDRRIHCPYCHHIHYRKVIDGCISDIRMSTKDDSPLIEDIIPMMASCRDFKEKDEDLSIETKGFMHRLWDNLTLNQTQQV